MTCSSHFFTNLESTILWWAHQVKLRIYESCFQLYLLWFFNCSKLREKKSYWTKFFGANMKLHAFPPAQNWEILAKKLVKTGFVVWSYELITELSSVYSLLFSLWKKMHFFGYIGNYLVNLTLKWKSI